jgi:uncharacterized UPF0146 family protein
MDYLINHESVDRYQAMHEIGIANVTAVISILRKQGVNIVADIHKSTNRYNEPVRYATWRLVKEDDEDGNQEFSN